MMSLKEVVREIGIKSSETIDHKITGWDWDYGAMNRSKAYAWTNDVSLNKLILENDSVIYSIDRENLYEIKKSVLEYYISEEETLDRVLNISEEADLIVKYGNIKYCCEYSEEYFETLEEARKYFEKEVNNG